VAADRVTPFRATEGTSWSGVARNGSTPEGWRRRSRRGPSPFRRGSRATARPNPCRCTPAPLRGTCAAAPSPPPPRSVERPSAQGGAPPGRLRAGHYSPCNGHPACGPITLWQHSETELQCPSHPGLGIARREHRVRRIPRFLTMPAPNCNNLHRGYEGVSCSVASRPAHARQLTPVFALNATSPRQPLPRLCGPVAWVSTSPKVRSLPRCDAPRDHDPSVPPADRHYGPHVGIRQAHPAT
jgi:hypothetical protein